MCCCRDLTKMILKLLSINVDTYSLLISCFFQPLKTGVPLFFTVHGVNSGGGSSSVTCRLPVFDITVPTGRLTADFSLTSNPNVIKANALVHDESDIAEAFVAVGFGEESYGDQLHPWTMTQLESEEKHVDLCECL